MLINRNYSNIMIVKLLFEIRCHLIKVSKCIWFGSKRRQVEGSRYIFISSYMELNRCKNFVFSRARGANVPVIVSRPAILDKFSMNFNVSQESRRPPNLNHGYWMRPTVCCFDWLYAYTILPYTTWILLELVVQWT